jgi:hypothetical protein
LTVHIRFVGSEVTHNPPLSDADADLLWAHFQQYLKEGAPSGGSYTLLNGRQEYAIHFTSVAAMTRTTGRPNEG